MRSIIALVQNEKTKAIDLAQKSIQADSQSTSSWMALSYSQQASFDLDGALRSAKHATKAEPGNALAWARLSDLELSFGNLDNAFKAAQEAEKINPHVSRIQTVLGFAYLTRIKINQAKSAFERAIPLDQADPLPRLGLGLAMIREGDLEKGRREIEIAASLDPQNSLIRSYLGKAYYDEKREKQAGEQYALAKQFDPHDPTPYLYDAFLKQSQNRPVEALQDIQKSIDLNDNRAIYRSRFLLDQDLATRSTSLGRIYRDLGFEQVAMVEGWKSVNADPSNYSAHRFLAETYSVLPRHEQGQANEILQSQLLQPININPVPPSLAANNTYVLEGTGPGEASFNEFTSLFLRNRGSIQFSGVTGEKNTAGDEIIVSGIHNNASLSASQYHYETKGFRDNNDRRTDMYNFFVQTSLTPSTSIQGEYRKLEHEQGDPELTFIDSHISTLRQKENFDSVRFGIKHSFSPYSTLLGSFMYQEGDIDVTVLPGLMEGNWKMFNYIGETSYIYRNKPFSLIAGAAYRFLKSKKDWLGLWAPEDTDVKERFSNIYAYGSAELLKNLSFTLGVSGEMLQGDIINEDQKQLNPKAGIVWHPLQSTTVRAAVFRSLQHPYLSDRALNPSLEPTQVGGFNQFYLGAIGDSAWRYGIGLDQKFSTSIYGGIEFLLSHVDETFIGDANGAERMVRNDRDLKHSRAYLFWTPTSSLALGGEYLYERVDADITGGFYGVEEAKNIRTHRGIFSVRYFNPLGLTIGASLTFIDQKGDFVAFMNDGTEYLFPGRDRFSIVDAFVSYRLPKRMGIVSFEAKNLFNRKFHFQDTDPANPCIMPGRLLLLKLTLSF